jgi:MFS family permease
VSTLIKWFPDRRGLATGMAIMGFGGGAMIGAPLGDRLMRHFATPTSVGVWQTFVVLGVVYFLAMMAGAFGYRIPRPDWKPAGWVPKPEARSMVTTHNVHVDQAWKTPQFWALWGVLCMNVSAGIGVLAMASPLIQEMFGGKLIGIPATLGQLTAEQKLDVARSPPVHRSPEPGQHRATGVGLTWT